MKYLDEYRDGGVAAKILGEIRRVTSRPWTLMEVCGGQTHSIVKHGIDRLLPAQIELVHGPGCPVCVTPLEQIDKAHAIARLPGVIFTSFGDMLRVPGSSTDLLRLRSEGADVRVVYAPMDAVRIAQDNPGRQVVFFGIGFETTAPANALAIARAQALGAANFTMLVSQVLVPPAITAVLQSPGNRVQGFLGPGHVCTVVGYREYEALARHYRVPIVITGFEPVDLLDGVLRAVRLLEAGAVAVENQYSRVVSRDGNAAAQRLVWSVFEVCDRKWRGIGTIPKSGLRLRYEAREHDAERRFQVGGLDAPEPAECISGQILRGLRKPPDCPAFGTRCTPAHPLGATMVSAEGACAAYHAYGRQRAAVGAFVKDAILRKARESAEVKEAFFRAEAGRIEALVTAMASAFRGGGRLYVMGNGGGATDAQHVAVEFCHPILEKRNPLPAIALTTDAAVITAIANDRDFAKIFADQLRVLAEPGDMALALSTSGQSPNLVQGLEAARELGLMTIAFTGKDGGRLTVLAEHAFVVPSFSIHRIQETHVALYHVVWDLVHVALGEDDVL